jgi:hypothetical protein
MKRDGITVDHIREQVLQWGVQQQFQTDLMRFKSLGWQSLVRPSRWDGQTGETSTVPAITDQIAWQ